ncbi:isocitrate lyase/PEP mutase family protein [Halobaculum roseum]|uniref:Isocitrate lyase/phosphoenolpyruvate mutase family protein n=1 Tax=Halobaculum roseum TaxID=2175149 RepID=A0ABD5MR23_9EURY|nr:isocitrate lyase/phosphoenolpyruvate mutase family protein [Halobaculum roseum]QZY02171.1 isocitrate lyase/phosphoenolpyruvate mutase family protein [Halobaculum roseum]
MSRETQRRRARTLRDLHTDSTDGPLLLANAWDAASAVVFERLGVAAVGTSSAGVAASLGYPDGEHVPREEMIAAIERIAGNVAVPVSADIEAGYGDTPEAVAETVARTLDAGAVGVNLEDGTGDPENPLRPTAEHAARIRAAREAADDAGIPAVVNGRTDVFWAGVGDEADRLDRAVERANAYVDAGSDCVFVPGVADAETIDALATRIDAPLNVLGGPGAPSVPELGDLGVARVSVGSGPMRATLGKLESIGEELLETGTYEGMEGGVPYGDLAELLSAARARREE